MARIVVTGAAGFIGRALCRALAERGHDVLGLTRGPAPAIPGAALRPIGTIGPHSAWRPHLRGAELVVHLATRAHQAAPMENGNEAAAARALACAAAASGVRRLVHMSSLRAMGEETQRGAPFRADDPSCPSDPYGRAKLAIERALATAAETGLELVILRPPLVYGPAVKGNLRALLRLVAAGLPLPFAAVDNHRSLVFLDNLVDLAIRLCLEPGAVGRIWLVRDVDLSTPDLVRALAVGLGRRPLLFPLPEAVFAAARRLPWVGPLAVRLTASLAADDRATRAALGWTPPFPPAAG
ncbi:MAG TPA: NAD-dependent epimerase/dehydratase family protein, partial [Stellaceae bacterium]|nr:NAD-dependent epimerase/dehydratase family protein [Stellaceae bacterium]